MNYLEAMLLGAIQGATEFLPVSSSAHIFLTEQWLGLESSLAVAAWLHVGSLIAVLIYYRNDIANLLLGVLDMLKTKQANEEGMLALKLGVATLLTIPLALILEKFIRASLSYTLIGITLILTGLLIVLAVYAKKQNQALTWPRTIALGLIQGLAVVPGISRSGLTIAAGILLGLAPKEAARFSFLLSIPTIAGAAVFTFASSGLVFTPALLFGMTASAVVGYLAIIWMTRLVEGKWIYFVPYCLLLGITLLFI